MKIGGKNIRIFYFSYGAEKLFNILALSSLFITYSPESNFCNGGMFGEWLQFPINFLTNFQYDFGFDLPFLSNISLALMKNCYLAYFIILLTLFRWVLYLRRRKGELFLFYPFMESISNTHCFSYRWIKPRFVVWSYSNDFNGNILFYKFNKFIL